MTWIAHAPSNIALIKYMGKKESTQNIPDNSSLSYTLNNLLSTVKLELSDSSDDKWLPLELKGTTQFSLNANAQSKFLQHLKHLKNKFHFEGNFLVSSRNNFPHSSGLASSASSFAALTRCAAFALSELTQSKLPSIEQQSAWSRIGSGSSCRSFYEPWSLWTEKGCQSIEVNYPKLIHQVIVISSAPKEISSSEAHQRVKSSLFYNERKWRAEKNLSELLQAFELYNWPLAYEICWREFQDMHDLFASCEQPFTYINAESKGLLDTLKTFWDSKNDGPLVTMDAGPNIHLLYRPDQTDLMKEFKKTHLAGRYEVL